MAASIAGRWMVVRDDGESLAIVDESGSVTFVGETMDAEVQLVAAKVADAGAEGRHFELVQMPDKEHLCDVLLKDEDGGKNEVLLLKGEDGYEETWRRTAALDGTPKIVSRGASSIRRRWTRESPHHDEPHDDEPHDGPTEVAKGSEPKQVAAGTGES
ncbi:unnamed protein product [Polarella glacialis]|uniref:Uncharacterized protein n=1 Tax=Polarella glacialis TaxID=89957 RepID=A0A813D6W5_POLGL|nr:unnamed protein product [Polarella glacialis]CAE8624189.1 unnamed protein product [Polarella glacialis]|mmetsp:Transcript_51644/g.83779  ORF Transcript_51644/g.83779 Transcript_51644/m.83779 type:complete len:158 (+) Transcript_51644:94-567(+)|eukprot:CAMPEP_0115099794 /NCGR_PEP_ID=MMETSP0227-20121206/32102_1 /TAXON_ID=89957 /ORGANISM="Polarella glacialis, Strain CCMP 1383" /LENGTH=157 /DNA_ID=CAMNT_0002494929 /DNA_START=92 /DNA_END=565 /DNA_ORIENTATION=-